MTEFMKLRKLLVFLILMLLIGIFTQINCSDLLSKTNTGEYFTILGGLCTILALYLSNKMESKKK